MGSSNSRFSRDSKAYRTHKLHYYNENTKGEFSPRAPNDVQIMYYPKAKEFDTIVKPLVERTYDKFLQSEGKHKELFSAYMGGQILVCATRVDGHVRILALTKEELPLVPDEALRNEFKKALGQPTTPFALEF